MKTLKLKKLVLDISILVRASAEYSTLVKQKKVRFSGLTFDLLYDILLLNIRKSVFSCVIV